MCGSKNCREQLILKPAMVGLVLGARVACALDAARFDYAGFLNSVRVPPEFTLELAAGEPAIRFPMFACFDDEGRLYVAESSGRDLYAGLQKLTRDCRVSRLEDADGDGKFEQAVVFQEGVTFPMGLAWHDDRLYLADPPDLVALTDMDADGRADKRETILSGFGHRDNGSLHGLTFGPDGLLYFTMGEPDGWKLRRGDGTFLEGVAGALFRAKPDGSSPEVISRGFENLVEVEFMPGGEIVGTDNWYQQPADGYRDALIDCAPGGLYPYAADRGTPLPRTGLTLPPLRLLPAVAHSGVTRLRAAGFPEDWRNSLLVAEHNTRKVVRHDLRRECSTFASTPADVVVGDHPDFHPSDVLEAPDGSLLIVDTGGWYVEHCPTGRIRDSRAPGGVYRMRWRDAPKPPDPHGSGLNWPHLAAAELAEHLRDARPLVAERAAREIERRREVAVLAAALDAREPAEARVRALWALGRVSSRESLASVRAQLTATDRTVACVAARALALGKDKAAGEALAELLGSGDASVRRAAAEALVECGSRSQAARVLSAMVKAEDEFEEHACIAALLAVADEPFVRGMLAHSSARARRAALYLLDQPPFASLRFTDLVAPLAESDPAVSGAARRLLERHAEWAGEAVPWLRAQILPSSEDPGKAGPFGNLLIAFQSRAPVRDLISEWLDPSAVTPERVRIFLLDLLPSLAAEAPEPAWIKAIPPALENPRWRTTALAAAAAYPRPEFDRALAGIAEDASVPISQRLLAARISTRQRPLSEAVFALAVESLDAGATALDRLGSIDLLAGARFEPGQMRRLLEVLRRNGTLAIDALVPGLARAADDTTRPLLAQIFAARLHAGWSPAPGALDLALSSAGGDSTLRSSLQQAWEKNHGARTARLEAFKPLLTGGNPERGREAFATATCLVCHRVGAHGGVIGPDLTRIGAIRSGRDLLEAIVYPGSSFAQGYEPFLLVRRDATQVFGSLVARGPEGVRLRDGAGVLHRIPPSDVATLDPQPLSIMPAGLEQLLSPEQFRDLLAYLQSLK